MGLLERARAAAQAAGLRHVYLGNLPGREGEQTACPRCRRVLVERAGFMLRGLRLREGGCAACGTRVPGIWS